MYGVILGFKEYDSLLGIMGSPFVGFDNFRRFFTGYYFADVMWNTFSISLYSLALGFPLPIIFALMINSVGNGKFKRTVQMISYAPYFISSVVIVALITAFFDTSTGVVSNFLRLFNPNASQNTLNSASAFKTVFVLSGVWQSLGWSCIIYIAALSGVDPQMYEAATLDGASKMQKIIYIDIPSIAPTMITLLILSMGNILSVGFEKVYLMQNPDNLASSEVIATYVYKKGLLSSDYGFGTAVGLFNSLINFAMLAVTNFVAKKTAGYSLW
ncbi:MAG: ABC transporter permease subunit [Clostridiales bacterium]|nr:ABC transporter permease subunit [Clostridiales bacterium]